MNRFARLVNRVPLKEPWFSVGGHFDKNRIRTSPWQIASAPLAPNGVKNEVQDDAKLSATWWERCFDETVVHDSDTPEPLRLRKWRECVRSMSLVIRDVDSRIITVG